jgi:hypothetical protein
MITEEKLAQFNELIESIEDAGSAVGRVWRNLFDLKDPQADEWEKILDKIDELEKKFFDLPRTTNRHRRVAPGLRPANK